MAMIQTSRRLALRTAPGIMPAAITPSVTGSSGTAAFGPTSALASGMKDQRGAKAGEAAGEAGRQRNGQQAERVGA